MDERLKMTKKNEQSGLCLNANKLIIIMIVCFGVILLCMDSECLRWW